MINNDLFLRQFTEKECILYLERVRWCSVPTCPYCKSHRATKILGKYRYHCNACNTAYAVTVNTLFHHTHIPLNKWFHAIALVLLSKCPISGRQLSIRLDVNKNTACGMVSNINRRAKDPAHSQLLWDIAEMVTSLDGQIMEVNHEG